MNQPGPPRRPARLLVVTAVEAERVAVRRGLGLPPGPPDEAKPVVRATGVGAAAAAATTARILAAAEAFDDPFGLVVCAGIAGGFRGRAEPGATVLARRSVAADLGAESLDGFLSLETLGFGPCIVAADTAALDTFRGALPLAVVGDVLTVSTVTGTAQRACTLADRYPQAVAEAMEGFGVATAAAQAGVGFAEIRTVANAVGPRDRASWHIAEALAALGEAVSTLAAHLRR